MAWAARRADAPEAAEIVQKAFGDLRRQTAENADDLVNMDEEAMTATFAWLRSRASPACDTIPSPSAVTSRLFDYPVRFTFEVLLEVVLIMALALLSSQSGSTFYGQRAGQLSIPVKSQG